MKWPSILFGLAFWAGLSPLASEWRLEELVVWARANAPDAQLALHRIEAAQGALRQADSLAWPRVQAQSAYTHTDQPASVFGSILNQRGYHPGLDFNHVPDTGNWNVRGVLTAPLFTSGRTSAARAAARADLAAARRESQTTQNDLEFEVVRSFHTIRKLRRFVSAHESAVKSLDASVAVAGRRVGEGALLKMELLEIQVNLSLAREDLARASNAARLAESALQALLGMEGSDFSIAGCQVGKGPHAEARPTRGEQDIRLSGDQGCQVITTWNVAGVITNWNGSVHPELRAARERLLAAQARVREAKGAYWPSLHAFGEVGHDRGSHGSGSSYAGGVLAQWDLWDGRKTKGRVSEAEANLAVAEEQERKLRFELQHEFREAEIRLEEALERLKVTGESVALAEQRSELAQARFAEGMALASQIIDAESNLAAVRARQAQAESDRAIALAALRKAAGLSQSEARNR